MEVMELVNAISTIGFPIVCCCVLFKQNSDLQKTLIDVSLAMKEISERISKVERSLESGGDIYGE